MTKSEKKIKTLEIKLKHLDNDLSLTKKEFNQATSKYLDTLKHYEQAADELRKKRQHLDSIIKTVPDIIYRLDEKGNFTFISDAVRSYGYIPEELIGTNVLDIVHPDDRKKALHKINERRTGERSTKCLELRLITKQKSIVPFEIKSTELHEDQKTFIIDAEGLYSTDDPRSESFIGTQGIARDILERKQADDLRKSIEKQLFQAQKMESIGRLAGGIAHDFNNILTGIMGYAELLHMKYLNSETTEEQASNVIMDGAERAAKLTQQLLGFARGGKYNPEAVEPNSTIKDIVKIIEKLFDDTISIKFDFTENIRSIEVDKNQFDQVVSNILINSKDAMPAGGKIVISTRNVMIDHDFASANQGFSAGEYVEICISDDGIGMNNDVKEHIFEPFFTTKGKSKRTGLGLATVYGILKNHNAQIKIDSVVGDGTIVKLFFPASLKVVRNPQDRKDDINILKGRSVILLIDDEIHIRNLSKKLLEELGYVILLASNGNEGIRIFEEQKETIELVLLDFMMPEMKGTEVYSRLKEIDPGVKVVFLSGYSKDVTENDLIIKGEIEFLQKPFRLHEVSQMISRVLNTSA